VVLVNDPTKPPIQDNIRKIIEMKFDNDPLDPDQIKAFKRIAPPGAPVETWTTETCGCAKDEPEPKKVPVEVPDPRAEFLALLALLAVLLADDLIPGLGEGDDPAIPVLLARLSKILSKLVLVTP
jgi:hypothetical protein